MVKHRAIRGKKRLEDYAEELGKLFVKIPEERILGSIREDRDTR